MMLRNSIDHGMESTSDRRKARKSEEGLIRTRFEPMDGALEMRYRDDGSGLNLAKIKRVGMQRGLIQADENDPMTTANLIYQTGFSTAQSVTEISGRGVGMDAVRVLIENEGGEFSLRFLESFSSFEQPIPFELVIRIHGSAYAKKNEMENAA
ncbi:MAG TPA: ATP-binding protein [Oligoflexus sp.]|uniref:ATP-binding protein n=1 Tax=Oligoflexus sp. TaxID=1971216 RepID=UPI002D6885A2|nr:ATP-binding protein [Oligoflexus sp.]HYX35097.1 ATP-binding protein [Oligoflexus sp.]